MIRTGQIGSGTERLVALEKLHPDIPDIHRALGEALGRQGEQHRALEEFRTAIQLSPNDAASQLSPNNEKFHQELADAYAAALRPADAQKEMETYNRLRARAQNGALSHEAAAPEQ